MMLHLTIIIFVSFCIKLLLCKYTYLDMNYFEVNIKARVLTIDISQAKRQSYKNIVHAYMYMKFFCRTLHNH